MKTEYKLEDVNEMMATVSVTMAVADWKRFVEQMQTAEGTRYPMDMFRQEVRQIVSDAEKHFSRNSED